jgi:hypothetical protein
MKLHSHQHGAHVQRGRRRLFTRTRSTWLGLAGFMPELLLVIGMGLICWAITWWSIPIALVTTGVMCIIVACLVALGSSRGS